MTYKQYYGLILAAQKAETEEMFINEIVFTYEIHSFYDDNADKLTADLENIYWVANASIADLRKAAGMTQAKLAARFAIPRRTIENWEAPEGAESSRACPIYTRLMIADLLGLVTVLRI